MVRCRRIVSGVKLYRTVAQEISGMIQDGSLTAGDQLPSIRALSQSRKVSPATVLKAYEALEADGLIEARPRSGYYIRELQARADAAPDLTAEVEFHAPHGQ